MTRRRQPVVPLPLNTSSNALRKSVKRIDEKTADLLRQKDMVSEWCANYISKYLLWIGAAEDALDIKSLTKHGIKGIVNCAQELASPSNLLQYGIEELRLELKDHCDSPIILKFGQTAEFIRRITADGSAVLIHCKGGVSRAPSITMAMMMIIHNISFAEAFSLVRTARPQTQPNLGFHLALQKLDKQNGTNTNATIDIPSPYTLELLV